MAEKTIDRQQAPQSLTRAYDRPKRIILVEDSDEDREFIEEMILAIVDGAVVVAVPTGVEALAEFETNGADCVILDYRLETEDGLDILDALKERAPFTPVIMMTGQGNEEIAARSIKVGASDYLVKQRLSRTYLRTAIDNAISRSALEAKVAEQEAQQRIFLRTLVHDLHAPLRNMRFLGEIAAEEADLGNVKKMKEALISQKAVANRASDLISTLEAYAMLDGDLNFRAISLTVAAKAARDNLSEQIAEAHAEVFIRELPSIQGDMPQLVQLFQNLISNGLKYNKSERPKVTIECNASDESIISVTDNGLGIPQMHFETIFKPLRRLWSPQEFEGSGIGLAICKKVVQRHDGRIWLTSEEGKGSTFYIQFRNSVLQS